MLLILDIGNTAVKAGVYNQSERISFSISEIDNFKVENTGPGNITRAAISSVVPVNTVKIKKYLQDTFSIVPFVISRENKFNLKINYDTPETLGMDRLCGCEGAYSLFLKQHSAANDEKPIISIDLGTATTINLIEPGGIFAGGLIAPGIETMNTSLQTGTAQLPKILYSDYKDIIGQDTKSSIASGIINATTGLIEKVISEIQKRFGQIPAIYLTGGNAFKIIPQINFDYEFVDDLVLLGIKAVFEKNN